MQVVRDDIWLCVECMLAAVNGEGPEDQDHLFACVIGLGVLGPNLVPNFDCNTGEGRREFSSCACEACKTRLAGDRYEFAVLGE